MILDALTASANWYFDGYGFVIVAILGVPLGGLCRGPRRWFWRAASLVLILIIPLFFIYLLHR